MLFTGVAQSAREIRTRVGRGELGGGILFPEPNFVFQKQLNSQFSLEFPKVNADLYSPVSRLGEENDECSVCLRDEFKNWFCYLFKLTSRQYEKYLCMYIRRKKKNHGLFIYFISCLNEEELISNTISFMAVCQPCFPALLLCLARHD